MIDTFLADAASECLKLDLQRARGKLLSYVSWIWLLLMLNLTLMCIRRKNMVLPKSHQSQCRIPFKTCTNLARPDTSCTKTWSTMKKLWPLCWLFKEITSAVSQVSQMQYTRSSTMKQWSSCKVGIRSGKDGSVITTQGRKFESIYISIWPAKATIRSTSRLSTPSKR